jgi:pyridoxal phosphate enzyme (YggS family)
MEETAIRLAQVRELMANAARKSGRTDEQIELVAVSKTHPAEKVQEAIEAGQLLFGESRVQEARAKIPLLPSRLRWHFIGHLQKNKIRHALPLFELFHGIDSLVLAQEMERIAEEEGMRTRVLLEVNVAGEASKHGFSPEALRRDLEAALSLGRLTIEGLMTLPPFASGSGGVASIFHRLAQTTRSTGS